MASEQHVSKSESLSCSDFKGDKIPVLSRDRLKLNGAVSIKPAYGVVYLFPLIFQMKF